MSAIAVAELTVDAGRADAFCHFIDFAHWDLWMPPEFRPISGPARALQTGDALSVGIGPKARLKVNLEVIRVRPGKEICWRGGNPMLLRGEHSFLFADADTDTDTDETRTRVRSEETFEGLLAAGPFAARLERAASDNASDLIARFSDYLKHHR